MTAPLSPLLAAWRSAPLPDLDSVWAVAPGGRAFALAGLFESLEQSILVVIPGEGDAEELVDDLRLFTDGVVFAPAWETLPFEHVSPNTATMAMRSQARHRIQGEAPVLVVASVRGAVQRLSSSSVAPIALRPGDEVDLDELAHRLAGAGYHRTDRVEARGEFAVRGGIVDIFPAQSDQPARLDFWGDTLDEIRAFSVSSQRSDGTLGFVEVFPAKEVRPDPDIRARAEKLLQTEPWAASTWDRVVAGQLFPGIESWLPWFADERSLVDELPPQAHLVVVDPARALDRCRDLVKEEAELAAALAPTWGEAAPEAGDHPALFLPLEPTLQTRSHLRMPGSPTGPDDQVLEIRTLDATPGDAGSVATGLSRLISRQMTTVVAMDGTAAARKGVTQSGGGRSGNRPRSLSGWSAVGGCAPRHPQRVRLADTEDGRPRRA